MATVGESEEITQGEVYLTEVRAEYLGQAQRALYVRDVLR
jgi:hypothetical protein